MTIEITGYSFHNGECHLFGNDVDERRLQEQERNREDGGSERELEFAFGKAEYKYLMKWLHRQKAVMQAQPKTIGEAVHASMGTVTSISAKFLVLV